MNLKWLLSIVSLLVVATGGYLLLSNIAPNDGDISSDAPPLQKEMDNGCLKNDEYADYLLNKNDNSVNIFIRDKYSEIESFSFEIKDIRTNYHPIEIHSCGVYIIKTFNYNIDKIAAGKWDEDFRVELWKYSYNSAGQKIILFLEQINKVYNRYYSDFRVSTDERYVSIIQGYLGGNNHALVIRDINKEENVFTLPIERIIESNPDKIGTIGLKEWTKDGRYFWFDLFVGANVNAFVRIERDTWNWEFLPTPENAMGGDKLNPETGWVTHNTLGIWTGIKQLNEEIKEQYQKEGRTGVFALYNLFTKEQIILETATDPTYFFKPNWISDAELEYYLPSGERKIYTLK